MKTIAFLCFAEVPEDSWTDGTSTSIGSHGDAYSPSNSASNSITESLQNLGLENVRVEPVSSLK